MVALTYLLPVILLPGLVVASARVKSVTNFTSGVPIRASANGNGTLSVSVAPGNTLVFDPPSVNASIGQTINFVFPSDLPVSVTQSAPNAPCTHLDFANGTVGFDSELQTSVIVTMEILDDEPIYFHCKHPGHCGTGMVGTINAPVSGNGSFAAFQAAALQLGASAPNDSTTGQPTAGNSGVVSVTQAATTSGAEPLMILGERIWIVSAACIFIATMFAVIV